MDNLEKNATAKRNRRTRNLVMVTSLSAVVLIASTYAWFTGLQSVSVEPFTVEISSADSLELSLNGEQWSDTLTLTKDNILNTGELGADKVAQKAYKTNTNNWPINQAPGTSDDGGKRFGLVPISTIGAMNTATSRMIMYEKSSMTTTPGGYRLLASTVDNDKSATEQKQKGYVAFDLFIKNYSGTQYLTNMSDPTDTSFEEAIYLNTDSHVSVATNAGGVASTGIENSVRVAFAQIGRISAYSRNASAITGITCSNKTDGDANDHVTGLCRNAQIWEPNDTAHKQVALNWYDKSCVQRTGATLTKSDYKTASDKCTPIGLTDYAQTYAIGKPIEVGDSDKVDVYDGLNGYDTRISTYNTFKTSDSLDKGPLVAFDYFRDTEKLLKGMSRPTFMTLAPNSITKVRVYIYIEGQDIDNFDYAQVGKMIEVAFGFTKQRYTAEEIIDTNQDQDLYNALPTAVTPSRTR